LQKVVAAATSMRQRAASANTASQMYVSMEGGILSLCEETIEGAFNFFSIFFQRMSNPVIDSLRALVVKTHMCDCAFVRPHTYDACPKNPGLLASSLRHMAAALGGERIFVITHALSSHAHTCALHIVVAAALTRPDSVVECHFASESARDCLQSGVSDLLEAHYGRDFSWITGGGAGPRTLFIKPPRSSLLLVHGTSMPSDAPADLVVSLDLDIADVRTVCARGPCIAFVPEGGLLLYAGAVRDAVLSLG
jgi:hypothetical protein